jgi:hypothetical protein
MAVSEEKEVRYPERAETLAELEQIVNDCPPWAVRKFEVVFQGKTYDYGVASRIVQQSGKRNKPSR